MADDREFSNVYTIPPNYTDSGKLLGGLLETRNTVEACILLLLVGWALAGTLCSGLSPIWFCFGYGAADCITGG